LLLAEFGDAEPSFFLVAKERYNPFAPGQFFPYFEYKFGDDPIGSFFVMPHLNIVDLEIVPVILDDILDMLLAHELVLRGVQDVNGDYSGQLLQI